MCKRDYTANKKPLTIDEQISLLTERGLQGEESQIRQALSLMTYYHFSGFCFHFLQKDEAENILEKFIHGTNISHIIRRYRFDLDLRHLLFVAIDHIETFLRRTWVEQTCYKFDAFYYSESSHYNNWPEHTRTINDIEKKAKFKQGHRGKEPFVAHYEKTYSNERLPIWMASEFMDFGDLTYFIKYSCTDIQASIAKELNLPISVLDSFLRALNTLRNACAHHSRIWDKQFGTRPMLPNRNCDVHWYAYYDERWLLPSLKKIKKSCGALETSHIGFLMFICRYFMNVISCDSDWHTNLVKLFDSYHITAEELRLMGLPKHWNMHPLWLIGK